MSRSWSMVLTRALPTRVMGKSVTLGWLCPRTVTLVTEPPFCDMSYMSLPIVTFGCTQMVRAERPRSGSKPPKIDPAIQIEVEAAIRIDVAVNQRCEAAIIIRSEEHTSELQSLMRISYAVFCLKKKKDENK